MTQATQPQESDSPPLTPGPPASALPSQPVERVAGLGQRTAKAFVWLLGQTLVGKGMAIISQVALGKLLLKDDFALIGLAMPITAFAGLIQEAGLGQILVHRASHFSRWATPAFWMSLALGLASAVVTVGAAPVVARFYAEPQLLPLLLVMALSAPVSSAGVVPTARLQADLRFKLLAGLSSLLAVLTAVLTVAMAWMHCGVYSLVVPLLISNVVRTVLLWSVAQVRVAPRLQVRRWRFLVGASSMMLLSGFFATVTLQADNLILAYFAPKSLGAYYYAYGLSLQTIQLLTATLAGVLFPVLSKLQDEPERQSQAFLNASRLLLFIGVPACFMQAVFAGPVLRIVFADKWADAIPIMQILSVGMAFTLLNGPAVGLLQAQGRFRTILVTTFLFSVTFLALIIPFTWRWQGTGTATAAAVNAALLCTILPLTAIRGEKKTFGQVAGIITGPMGCAGVAGAVAVLPFHLPGRAASDWTALVVGLFIFVIVYLGLSRYFFPHLIDDLVARVRALAGERAVTVVDA